MILVILGVCIALVIGGFLVFYNTTAEEVGIALMVVGSLAGIVALIVTIALSVGVSNDAQLDSKIAMYTAENAIIEQQIAECVERYQEYEQGVFEKVSPTDAVAFVTLYPELKSDTLVQAQIETYVENNNKIKQLKEKKIDASVRKWWLYFGG